MMMRNMIFFIVVLFAACTNNDKVPKDIIPREKMQKLMWDMLQADRFAELYLTNSEDSVLTKTRALKEYQKVFNIHKISRDEFIKSYKFYLSRPDLSRVMFDSISAQAERRRAEVYNKRPAVDSIRKEIKKRK